MFLVCANVIRRSFCHKSAGSSFGFAGCWSHPDVREQMVNFFISLHGPKWLLDIGFSLHYGWIVQDSKHVVSSTHSLTSAILYSKGIAFRKCVAIIQMYFSAEVIRKKPLNGDFYCLQKQICELSGKGGSTPYERASWNCFKFLKYWNMLTNAQIDNNLQVLQVQDRHCVLKNFCVLLMASLNIT